MVGWLHRLNGHKFEQTPADGEEQGSLACCSPWGCRVRHDLATERQTTKPGIKLGPPAEEVRSSNHWTTREFLGFSFI